MRLNQRAHFPQPGLQLKAIGWGKLSINSVRSSNILQHINVTSLGDEACSRLFSEPSLDIMCAKGFNSSGTCRGDSGGPLVFARKAPFKDVQVGIVSFSITECVHRTLTGECMPYFRDLR